MVQMRLFRIACGSYEACSNCSIMADLADWDQRAAARGVVEDLIATAGLPALRVLAPMDLRVMADNTFKDAEYDGQVADAAAKALECTVTGNCAVFNKTNQGLTN